MCRHCSANASGSRFIGRRTEIYYKLTDCTWEEYQPGFIRTAEMHREKHHVSLQNLVCSSSCLVAYGEFSWKTISCCKSLRDFWHYNWASQQCMRWGISYLHQHVAGETKGGSGAGSCPLCFVVNIMNTSTKFTSNTIRHTYESDRLQCPPIQTRIISYCLFSCTNLNFLGNGKTMQHWSLTDPRSASPTYYSCSPLVMTMQCTYVMLIPFHPLYTLPVW